MDQSAFHVPDVDDVQLKPRLQVLSRRIANEAGAPPDVTWEPPVRGRQIGRAHV